MFFTSVSQVFDKALLIPRSRLENTTFVCLELADSFSKKGDSVRASFYFSKVHPLQIEEMEQPLDSLFVGAALTEATKSSYRQLFERTIKAPRTKAYLDFKAMCDEDQAIRRKLDNCGDSFTCAVYGKQMRETDSVHFIYLYNYVKKNGWPTIENGSLYAQYLAIHDRLQYDYYIPIIREAVLAGVVPVSSYYLMLGWKWMQHTTIKHLLSVPTKVVIDVSSTINNILPDSVTIKTIVAAANEHCPIRYMAFVYESNDEKDVKKWWNYQTTQGEQDVMWRIYYLLNCPPIEKSIYTDHNHVYGKMKKMKLYLVY